MALTHAQRMQIADVYAPVMYFHPEERFLPIRPDSYIRKCALWRGDGGRKEQWGNPPPGWPRLPTIPRGGISLDPAEDVEGASDPDGDGVPEFYLGHAQADQFRPYLVAHEGEELWLDGAGWRDSATVTELSLNLSCNPDVAATMWEENDLFEKSWPWYSAEVMEMEDFSRLLLSLSAGSVEQALRTAFGEIWVVWYYFLYPIHEERLRRCEQLFDAANRGDYEGDWNAVGVVIPKPADLPWEAPGAVFPPPSHVAFGVRLRGLSEDLFGDMMKQAMVVRTWNEVHQIPGTNHARVFVTRGYHNNYSDAGDQQPVQAEFFGIPVDELSCSAVSGIQKIKQDIEDGWDDFTTTVADIAVLRAKIAAGAGIGFDVGGFAGGMIGSIAGAASGILEMLSGSDDDQLSDQQLEQLEAEPGSIGGQFGTVVKPADVADPDDVLFGIGAPPVQETAKQVLDWGGTTAERLVDRPAQLWWPPLTGQTHGYQGRWGVRCAEDGRNRRSGIAFPDFTRTLINALVGLTAAE